ncbi:MAG TPA: DUF2059 domain-containing protein [Thermoanaerobaculia bacterium]|nr:DUF2059 domain-containing protein [Thermoanaerobaculia bacterium]
MRKLLTVALLVLWTVSAHAQPTGAAPRPAVSSHEQAVTELFQLMDLEKAMVGGATVMIDAQINSHPEIAPFRGVMIEWSSKYLTWDSMAPQLIKIYMDAFTEAETREMIAFYRTPTGRKALTKLPELFQKGAAVGAEIGKAHQAELAEMVRAKQKELDAEKKPGGQ